VGEGVIIGVSVDDGTGVNVEVGIAACVCAIAVWRAYGDGEQADRKIVAKQTNILIRFLYMVDTLSCWGF
jgi:hypothetical protein